MTSRLRWATTAEVVRVVWAVLTVQLSVYVAWYGRDLPSNDEWAFVPVLFADAGHQLRWLFERHVDHRYPLARAAFLSLFHLSGGGFRAGQFANVALLSVAAALWSATLSRLRGRASLVDAWTPLLLLHRGHCENVLMGYQLAFTIPAALCAFFAWTAASSPTGSNRRVLGGAFASAAALSLCGAVGLLFAPWVALWTLWEAKRRNRLRVTMAMSLPLFAFLGWSFTDMALTTSNEPRNGAARMWLVWRQLGENAFGCGLVQPEPLFGSAVLFGGAVGFAVLAYVLWTKPERGPTLGILAVAFGTIGFYGAVGYGRDNGVMPRFGLFACLLPLVGIAALAKHRWAMDGAAFFNAVLLIGFGTVVLRGNHWEGNEFARRYAKPADAARADAATGMPIDVLAERRRFYWTGVNTELWQCLHDHDHPATRGAAPMRLPTQRTELLMAMDSIADPRLPALPSGFVRYRLVVPEPTFVSDVRIDYETSSLVQWEPFRLHWITLDSRGAERVHFETLPLWTMPGPGRTALWVNGTLVAAWIESGRAPWPVVPLRASYAK